MYEDGQTDVTKLEGDFREFFEPARKQTKNM